jgi:hypothetical protein
MAKTNEECEAVAGDPVHEPEPGGERPAHGPPTPKPNELQTPMERLRGMVEFPETSTDDEVISHAVDLIENLRERLNAAEMARFLNPR